VISKSRNVIQNGNFDVWQRGTTFTAVSVTSTMLADRWKISCSNGGAVTVTRDADVPNASSLYSFKVVPSTADDSPSDAEFSWIRHNPEGYSWMNVYGKPMTLSFWVKSNKTGTYCIHIRASGADETFLAEYTISSSATWEKKIINVPPIPAGTWGTGTAAACDIAFPLMPNVTYAGVVGWQSGNKYTTGNQVNFMDSTSNYWILSQVQLEAGSSATEFEVKDPTEVLASCQRYLVRYGGVAFEWIGVGFNYTTAICYPITAFPVEMRAAPGLAYSVVSDWTVLYGGGSNSVCTAISIASASTKKAGLACTVTGTPLTAGSTGTLGAINSTASRLYFSAEL